MKDRSDMPEEIRTLQEQGSDRVYACMTPAERIGIMWQLALDAWAFKGEPVTDHRVPRHITRLIRRD